MGPKADLPSERGVKLLHDPVLNKGTAFTEAERDRLGLRGLLPPRVHTQDEQVRRVLENVANKSTDLERYLYLVGLQDRNERLFYRAVMDHVEELMPLIYTPTVGRACQVYGHVFRRSRGLYISLDDRGKIGELLRNWPHPETKVIVVTDGERILGLGDLGTDGMGIPIGKLNLYTACAGVDPTHCLPVTLDVGTDNEALRDDPLYLGAARERLRGPEYDAFVSEFLEVAAETFPNVLIQLEDFGNANAFRLLEAHRDRFCLFDDDIQGTGAVALAGFYSAMRVTGGSLADQRVLFLGAGEAGLGIADALVAAMSEVGLSQDEARRRCFLFDSRGLVIAGRDGLSPHKLRYAHEMGDAVAAGASFGEAIQALRPTAIVGASGQPGLFDEAVLQAMGRLNERPIVFALSNPTSKSECTAEAAYGATEGRALFASGSPFAPVDLKGRRHVPGQANNAYVFPGVGLGVLASQSSRVTDEMFLAAARALADEVDKSDLEKGRLYPGLDRIREVSIRLAAAVAEVAYARGLARRERPADLDADLRAQMLDPSYPVYA